MGANDPRASDTGTVRTVSFSREDVQLFARASGDTNPLHLCVSYSRRTAFGRPVVHGVLGVLAALGSLPAGRGHRIARVTAEFPGAMFTDIDYTVDVAEGPGGSALISLIDGTRTMLTVEVTCQPGEEPRVEGEGAGSWPREHPADPILTDAAAPPTIAGVYRPDDRHLGDLMNRFVLDGNAVSRNLLGVLLCGSYLTGMELPGTRSMLTGLSIDLTSRPDEVSWPLRFAASGVSLDERFDLLRYTVDMTSGDETIASLSINAFLRPEIDAAEGTTTKQTPTPAQTMRGMVAVVTGASRGLGARLTADIVARGGTVYANYRESHESAERLRNDLADASGAVVLSPGDAGDAAWWKRLRASIESTHGRLDLLILNACPPLVPLSLDAASVGRVEGYIGESVSYVANPLAVLGDLVSRGAGWFVVVSSAAVEDPPVTWPHYVAAKLAIEGLAEVAAASHRDAGVLIARPPLMRTALTSTPMGHAGAIAPALVASSIIDRLSGPRLAGRPVWLGEFTLGEPPVRVAA